MPRHAGCKLACRMKWQHCTNGQSVKSFVLWMISLSRVMSLPLSLSLCKLVSWDCQDEQGGIAESRITREQCCIQKQLPC
jgi:hypothetical protein